MATLTGTNSTLGLGGLSIPSTPALSGLGTNVNPALKSLGTSFTTSGQVQSPETTAIQQSFAPAAIASGRLNPIVPPTSPLTKKPLSGFGTIAPSAPMGNTPLGAGLTDSTYNFLPSETADAYNSRISAYNAAREQNGTLTPSDHLGGATPTTLANGGIASTNQSGQVTSPTTFGIDTSGTTPSSALAANYSYNDVTGARNSYANYLQGLATAQQYSPEYTQALQAKQAADATQAKLGANFYTGNNLPGDTLDYAQGATAKAQELNSLNQLQANQALDVQTLLRNGNIAAAQALVQGTQPQSVSAGSSLVSPVTGEATYNGLGGYQAIQGIQTVNNLAQTYPDAGIQPTDNLTTAQQKASQAPSFSSRQLVQVTLPGGGVEFVNKNQLQTNPDGTYTIVSTAQGATNKADAESLATQTQYADTITRALTTADSNFGALTNLMQKAGINDTQTPIINQLNNKFQLGIVGNGDIAAFNSSINNLRAEYAQVLAKGGVPTDSVRAEANQLIPDNLNLSNLKKVQTQINTEGANAVQAAHAQVKAIQSRLTAPTQTGSGSIYDF